MEINDSIYFDPQKYVKTLLEKHPTKQADLIRNLQSVLVEYSKQDLNDPRSSPAQEFATEVRYISNNIKRI